MFRHTQEPITDQEMEQLERKRRRFTFSKLIGRPDPQHDKERTSVDVYQARVLQCFIPPDFNEELPLYVLDLGGVILILFGQWVFDPHTLIAHREIFEAWNCEEAFFGSFSLRCLAASGTVFQLDVEGPSLVQAQRLPTILKFKKLRECQLVYGHAATLIRDLEEGGLIDAP